MLTLEAETLKITTRKKKGNKCLDAVMFFQNEIVFYPFVFILTANKLWVQKTNDAVLTLFLIHKTCHK